MLVDTFLNSVYLYDDDHLVLVMNYSGENCKVDLKLVEGAVSGDDCKGSAFAPSSVFNDDKRGFPEVFQEALFVYKKPKIMHEYEFYGICPNLLTNWRSK